MWVKQLNIMNLNDTKLGFLLDTGFKRKGSLYTHGHR